METSLTIKIGLSLKAYVHHVLPSSLYIGDLNVAKTIYAFQNLLLTVMNFELDLTYDGAYFSYLAIVINHERG